VTLPATEDPAAVQTALARLLSAFGCPCSEIAQATRTTVAQLRRAHRDGGPLPAAAGARLLSLHQLVRHAAAPGQEPRVAAALSASLVPGLSPTLLDVLADGDGDDLVAAVLRGALSGIGVLDAWRPGWRGTYRVSRWKVVTAADGLASIVPRPPAEVRAAEARLGIPSAD
jgi:hypothetical protein